MNESLLIDLPVLAKKAEPSTKVLFAKLKKRPPKNLDDIVHKLHEELFQHFDCLECANCCKSISPGLHDKDVDRIAKAFRTKPSEIVKNYLYLDNEGEYVFRETPCPFLQSDNYCMIYEDRSKACREYPHTDRKRFYQLLPLTLKNTYICPVVYLLVERLKEEFKNI